MESACDAIIVVDVVASTRLDVVGPEPYLVVIPRAVPIFRIWVNVRLFCVSPQICFDR